MEQGKTNNFLAISILAAAVIIGGSFIYGNSVGDNNTRGIAQVVGNEANGGNEPPQIVKGDLTDDDVILGDPDAPVTMVEFGDYQCPFCKKLSETEERIRKEYVETGKLRMVFRDFPLDTLHPEARAAALAAQCAKDQGKYWQYHDVLFERQQQIPTMDYVAVASELGMNTSSFSECVNSKKYADEIEKDYQAGVALGVRGTPSSFINGKNLSGALPYEAFRDAIEEALKEAQG